MGALKSFPFYTLFCMRILNYWIFILFFLTGCSSSTQQMQHLVGLLHEGDLAFRRGNSFDSFAVVMADKQGAFSHVGIVVRAIDDSLYIVHAVPDESVDGIDRLKCDLPSVFFAADKSSAGAILRLKKEAHIAHQAAKHALALYSRGVLFDHAYNYQDTTAFYCTELIDYVYSCAGVHLTNAPLQKLSLPFHTGYYRFPSDLINSGLLYTVFSFQ